LHFVNWQREVSIEELNGKKVVVKRNKSTKEFHEFLLIYIYSLISLILTSPSSPPIFSNIKRNEGRSMRKYLEKIGISTPDLISISDIDLVEEYIEGGDLYSAFASGQTTELAFDAGGMTAKMHNAGYAFVDNKAQNYLVRDDSVIRTDLGFIKKGNSSYARGMDIGSFLASIMDLERYGEIEHAFFNGYTSEYGHKFSILSLILRNMLSLGFSSNGKVTFRNMMRDTMMLIDV